jgi:hypothetical protein
MIYKIPVTWQSWGTVKIEADSLEDAVKIFDETVNEISLPEAEYVDDSFKREDDDCCKYHNT